MHADPTLGRGVREMRASSLLVTMTHLLRAAARQTVVRKSVIRSGHERNRVVVRTHDLLSGWGHRAAGAVLDADEVPVRRHVGRVANDLHERPAQDRYERDQETAPNRAHDSCNPLAAPCYRHAGRFLRLCRAPSPLPVFAAHLVAGTSLCRGVSPLFRR
jgi:hypothetical protein